VPGKRIVNASPLVFLAREDLLEMLPQGGFDVLVPEAVIEEIRAHGLADPTVVAIGRVGWLAAVPAISIPTEVARWNLGPGESAVLALARAEPGAIVVIDDQGARRCARSLEIPLIGTLGLVLRAKREGRIPEARPVVERLRGSGMYLSDQVIKESLALVGE
jgi:predicted nucleic acid-binding protein